MIELIQVPWSPFCLVQRRILEYSGAPFKTTNASYADRSLIWRLTRQRYYSVPTLRDGRTVVFETDNESQVIAKYLDGKLQLDLFPRTFRGVDRLLWRYIENEIEGCCFKINDAYWQEFLPKDERLAFLRHKERKFGRGCLDLWRDQQPQLNDELTQKLVPFEMMLVERDFLLQSQPHFIDFDLWGMLACALYSGHYRLPAAHNCLNEWYSRMSKLKRHASSQ
ncbi:MAG TPA: glutathione S-transferase N-terminal domain-containing protein [Verrucomicrobiae bacterium]|jgi:glutathione S-transferase